MVHKHGALTLDLNNSNKAKLYENNKLMFLGDGYRAITMFIRATGNDPDVKSIFASQLKMREKPKFSKEHDLETLRLKALAEAEEQNNKKTKRKR